jgi:tRNA (uracil-5-)-methyltransferase
LYTWIGEWCRLTQETTLLDICCGTGTIGISLAKKVKQVIGVEISEEAIADARVNAAANGVRNINFHCGRAEDILLLSTYDYTEDDNVVAVLDPPRAGIHSDVIRTIRRCKAIRRLIYVSCKPSSATQNVLDLTRQASRRFVGGPFRLMEVKPVDLFPHTDHCEIILRFERFPSTAPTSTV